MLSIQRTPIYERAVPFRRFPDLPVFPFDKINKKTKMRVERWWNDADREREE
jgi:hypothetical protein